MVCVLADGSEEKIAGTEAVHSFYLVEFTTRGMSSDFAKAPRLQYPDKKMDFFGDSSIEAQDALLRRRSSSAAFVADESQASLATTAGADDTNDDDYDWNLKGAIGFENVERVGAKRCLREF